MISSNHKNFPIVTILSGLLTPSTSAVGGLHLVCDGGGLQWLSGHCAGTGQSLRPDVIYWDEIHSIRGPSLPCTALHIVFTWLAWEATAIAYWQTRVLLSRDSDLADCWCVLYVYAYRELMPPVGSIIDAMYVVKIVELGLRCRSIDADLAMTNFWWVYEIRILWSLF